MSLPSQKTVYFDTNIYNHLLDRKTDMAQLKNTIDSDGYAILLMPMVLEEMVAAGSERAAALSWISFDLCSHKHVIKKVDELICDELRVSLDGNTSISPFMDSVQLTKFKALWKFTTHKSNLEIPEDIINSSKQKTKSFKLSMGDNKALLTNKWQSYPSKTFSDFYSLLLNNDEINKLLSDLFNRCFDNNTEVNKLQALDVKSLLASSTALRFCINANLKLIHHHLVQNGKPKSGDDRDIHHMIASYVADIFVTDDEHMRTLFNDIGEQKLCCIDLDTFLKRIGYAH